jgi:hypothetical protein
MHFFEQVFHLWPDGGDGSTEIAAMMSLLVALVFCWHVRRYRGSIFTLISHLAPKPLITDGEANADNY